MLSSDFEIIWVAATETTALTLEPQVLARGLRIEEATAKEMEDAGTFQSNDGALAIARMKENREPKLEANQYCLVLDDIRDPGNLGTIIRTADWYGITHIIASLETTDQYNPKTIAATMGSFCRVGVYYCHVPDYLAQQKVDVYGAFLNGENIHQTAFGAGGFIVIGNESNGVTPAVEKFVTRKITIPRKGKAESLNAAIATAIILDHAIR